MLPAFAGMTEFNIQNNISLKYRTFVFGRKRLPKKCVNFVAPNRKGEVKSNEIRRLNHVGVDADEADAVSGT